MDPERLISDYLDDVLPPEDVATLFQWIQRHPDNARQFASAAFMHRRLQHRLSAMRRLQEDAGLANEQPLELPPQLKIAADLPIESTPEGPTLPHATPAAHPQAPRSTNARQHLWAIAAALLVIIGVFAFVAWPRTAPARLVAAVRATWEPGAAPPKEGDRLLKRALVLNSGLIKLAFDNGNQLIIEGPARFTVTDADTLTLDHGTLTAVVTPAGHGFRVLTPTAQVTDLGTEFGVQASATATRVAVFTGTVRVQGTGGGATSKELTAGNAVELSTAAGLTPVPFSPATFKRAMPAPPVTLDLVDLLAGGDGTGSASGVGIDAATGRTRETRAVTVRLGNHKYVRINDPRILDGCFIPGGRMPVDSAGNLFTFPATSTISFGLIWAGPNAPWGGELAIATTLPADAGHATSRVLVMHSNNAVTLNLDAIRALHAPASITGFRARVGNSYRPATPDALPATPLASIHVLVDGIARFEKRAFPNTDPPIDLTCPISDTDHFLTLATTDGGDGNSCDWVLWTLPEFTLQPHP